MQVWHLRLLIFAAVILGGWGVTDFLNSVADRADPPLLIEWPVADLGDMSIGPHQIDVRISNLGRQSRRIVGMKQGCSKNVCFGPCDEGSVTVEPGATIAFKCELKITDVGPFSFPLHLFLEENGIREEERLMHGIGTAPVGKFGAVE